MKTILTIVALAILGVIIYNSVNKEAGSTSDNMSDNPVAILHTNQGDIEIELFLKETPKTVENFITLSERDFYN